jgi:hypothetical protein
MDSKKTTITIIVLSLLTFGAYYFYNKNKVVDSTSPNNNNTIDENNPTKPTKPTKAQTTKYCEGEGEPLDNYLDKFTLHQGAIQDIAIVNYPKNCRNWIVKDIVNEANFEVGNGYKGNLNGGIVISQDYYGIKQKGYYVGGNVGGIRCRVLLSDSFNSAAYYDYDTCDFKGYNSGIYYTKDFAKYKCKNIPYVFIKGSQNDPIKIIPPDKQNPLMLPYLQQAATQYNAFIYGKDWDGSYDLSGTDFYKPTNQIESLIAQEALASQTANQMVDYFLSHPETYSYTIKDGVLSITDRCPNGMPRDREGRCEIS